MAGKSGKLHALTALQVQQAADGDHGDGGGLLLRIDTAKGRANWVFRYTSPTGRRREMGLGACQRGSRAQAGDSLVTARDLAHEAREQLRRSVDPLAERELRRQAAMQAEQAAAAAEAEQRQQAAREHWTLARCARDYHERVIEPSRTAKHSAQWIASLENHVPPALWHTPVQTITAPALLAALQAVKPHERARRHTGDTVPETLRRIRQRLDSIFEDAIFHERATVNPAAAIKRKMREAAPKRQARGKFAALAYGEAPALAQRLRTVPGTAARALELALLTAARTSEVLLAEWREFDLDAGTWTVPAERMKAREPHVVYLAERAIELLQAQQGQDLHLVFPSPVLKDGQARPLSNMAMLATLDRLGMRDRTTVHGLCRATFSTWANETGAARPDVIEACLAHKEGDRIRASYNRSEFAADRRKLLGAWAEYLQRPAATVTSLRSAA